MDMKTREAVEKGENVASEGLDKAKEAYSQGKEAAIHYATKAKDAAVEYASQAKQATQTHIKENPFWSMLIAVGVGVAIGTMLSAAFHRED